MEWAAYRSGANRPGLAGARRLVVEVPDFRSLPAEVVPGYHSHLEARIVAEAEGWSRIGTAGPVRQDSRRRNRAGLREL